MPTEFFMIAVVILIAFAAFDLMVGVSNDAVNFLNSAIGSRVAPIKVIMIIASLGILTGVTFSGGMMEVARKGIFHPQFFTMPELLTIFLGVMITDIILLDLFNTFGLPTSTTVSIVFELLGGAVAVSVLKIISDNGSITSLGEYINTAKALVIIFGILLSVIVAFTLGALIQFFTRLLFSFNYLPRLSKLGGLWGGVAMSSVFYFILLKGVSGASFLTPETISYIKNNGGIIMIWTFILSAVVFQILIFFKVNILKPLILIGTFALAMAFAANDLVNFIGVPLAGLASYKAAMASDSPLTIGMGVLAEKVPTSTYLLLIAGGIMVVTLWISRKARTVTQTEISLGQQAEGTERFESVWLARTIVRIWINIMETIKPVVPEFIRNGISKRMDPHSAPVRKEGSPSFDLMRASVNLMVASGCISFATSQKLPLSTTYVTFMVAMGTSFADRAWGRESAVYRITGVLTVIGGWFFTAFSAFIVCGLVAALIFITHMYAVPFLLAGVGFAVWRGHQIHNRRAGELNRENIFNLKKIKDAPGSVATTFEHMSHLIRELRKSLDLTLDALFRQDLTTLKLQKKNLKKFQNWSNIIIANMFKSMRLLQRGENHIPGHYSKTIRRLQQLSDCCRDITMRAVTHVDNQHAGLIDEQIQDLKMVKEKILDIFFEVEHIFNRDHIAEGNSICAMHRELKELVGKLNQNQVNRIVDETSKTRLSILFYAVTENSVALSKQLLRLAEIFNQSFGGAKQTKCD